MHEATNITRANLAELLAPRIRISVTIPANATKTNGIANAISDPVSDRKPVADKISAPRTAAMKKGFINCIGIGPATKVVIR